MVKKGVIFDPQKGSVFDHFWGGPRFLGFWTPQKHPGYGKTQGKVVKKGSKKGVFRVPDPQKPTISLRNRLFRKNVRPDGLNFAKKGLFGVWPKVDLRVLGGSKKGSFLSRFLGAKKRSFWTLILGWRVFE